MYTLPVYHLAGEGRAAPGSGPTEKFRDAAALWFGRACALRYGITMAILRSATVILLSTVSSVIAQDLMATDQQLGLNHHQQVLAHYQLISQGQIYERLQRVFTRMTQTPDFNGGANLRYQLFYLDSSEINAYSVGGGTMYVTAGLMQAIQGNEGVLAFVMGHEMVHSRNQHLAKKQLRLAVMNYQYRQIFKQNGQLAATIYLTAARISEAKVDRDAEHEADQVGLRIAAEAGYHPDYAIFAARVLRAEAGESRSLLRSSQLIPVGRRERSGRNITTIRRSPFSAPVGRPLRKALEGAHPPSRSSLSSEPKRSSVMSWSRLWFAQKTCGVSTRMSNLS